MSRYYMFYKPRGYVTACRDFRRPTIMEFLTGLDAGLHPVGRLDRDSEGLLLLTDDGTLDNRLLQPAAHVSKDYAFAAFGILGEQARQALCAGVLLPPDTQPSKPAQLWAVKPSTAGALAALLPRGSQEALRRPDKPALTGILRITEGRKHQVRRMLGAVGCRVFYLKRQAIGALQLDCTLAPGQYRLLLDEELSLLTQTPADP